MYVIIALLFGIITAAAQPPDSLWSRVYDNGQSETCEFGFETSDHNLVFGGRTGASSGIIYGSGWIIKTDGNGNIIWSRTLTPGPFTYIFSGCEAQNGNYLFAGWVHGYPDSAATNHFWLACLDSNGDSLWSRFYGGSESDQCFAMVPTSDGGYALAGETAYRPGVISFWLVKVDSNGDSMWSHIYGLSPPYDARLKSVQQTSDGGYVLVGQRVSSDTGSDDYWIVRTNAEGDSVWSRTYGGSEIDVCYSVLQNPDGGYLLLGSTESFGHGQYDYPDIWLLQITDQGDSVNSKIFGGESHDDGLSIKRTVVGDYVIAGGMSRSEWWYTDLMTMKVNSDLDSLWGLAWGVPPNWEIAKDIALTSDGGVVIFGQRRLYGSIDWDFWIIRLMSDTATSAGDHFTEQDPDCVRLGTNYPNPFNAVTTISVDLPRESHVLLNVFDITGRSVARLADGMMTAGVHRVNFDASRLPSGVYVYRLQANGLSQSRKLVVLK